MPLHGKHVGAVPSLALSGVEDIVHNESRELSEPFWRVCFAYPVHVQGACVLCGYLHTISASSPAV